MKYEMGFFIILPSYFSLQISDFIFQNS